MSRFWQGGMSRRLEALGEEEKEILATLEEALDRLEDPDACAEMESRIKAIKTEFKVRRKDAERSLYSTE